jgi:hypothetical protein
VVSLQGMPGNANPASPGQCVVSPPSQQQSAPPLIFASGQWTPAYVAPSATPSASPAAPPVQPYAFVSYVDPGT